MAVYYFDTSALVKRYSEEVGTAWVMGVTAAAAGQDIYIVRTTGPEMIAAFFRKTRTGEVTLEVAVRAATNFKADFRNQYQVVEVTAELADRAMTLAQQHSLRGYDAVQLAAASELHTLRSRTGLPPFIFISADNVLNTAARTEGLVATDPNEHI